MSLLIEIQILLRSHPCLYTSVACDDEGVRHFLNIGKQWKNMAKATLEQ